MQGHLADRQAAEGADGPIQRADVEQLEPGLGRGGTCCGDSGGPVFGNNENIILGITSFGMNGNCKGEDWAHRADLDDAQNFVLDFHD